MHLRSKTVQQLLSVILSVVMVLSMLPMEVLAQETPPVTTPMDLTAITEAMKEFQRTSQNAFNEWFATVQGLLDEDVAGRLINKTNDLDERLTALEYMVIHNDLFTHVVDDDGNPILDDDGNAIIGDWKYKTA